jgi:hypothetical protein
MNKLSKFIITSDLKPTRALKKVLAYFSINPELSFEHLVAETQKQWLRPPDSERWQLQETASKSEKKQLMHLFESIGLVSAIAPIQLQYDYILFMGGDLPGNLERLDYLNKLWHQNVRAKKIIFLTSSRPLDPIHESYEKIRFIINKANLPINTEYDLLKMLYSQMQLPSELRAIPIEYVNTPHQIRNGRTYRATTPDTIMQWLQQHPKPGSCLVISSQPLIGYQDAVARTLLNHNFYIESVGPQADNNVTTLEFLDSLARWIYQENEYLKKN